MSSNPLVPRKKFQFPNTYVIVFTAILLCAMSTWFVPGGEYVRTEQGTSVYRQIESVPQTWQIFSALYKGFEKQAGVIVFILIVGGALWIVNSTKALDTGISVFLSRMQKLERFGFLRKIGVNNIIIVMMTLLFSLFGGVFGMSEECIAFVAIAIPLSISMGYDSITGVGMVYVGAHVGFAGAFLNPFTVGVAQEMAGLPLFSGIEYRLLCWAVLTILLIAVLLFYAGRIRKCPQKSPMYELDAFWREKTLSDSGQVSSYRNKGSVLSFLLAMTAIILFTIAYSGDCVLHLGGNEIAVPWLLPVIAVAFGCMSIASLRKSVHFYIVVLLAFTIVFLITGALCFSWYIPEISALFLALAILSGIASGADANKIASEFIAGAKDIFSAAFIVGLASGIIIILQDGKVIDTILHSMEASLEGAGKVASLGLMYGIQTFINLFIPSATAKAAITMPVMAPFSDLIGLSRQATVLAFQFGDGFTNMITPTSGVLMAVLGMARIPYAKWVRWAWKLILMLIVAGFILLLPAVFFHLEGF